MSWEVWAFGCCGAEGEGLCGFEGCGPGLGGSVFRDLLAGFCFAFFLDFAEDSGVDGGFLSHVVFVLAAGGFVVGAGAWLGETAGVFGGLEQRGIGLGGGLDGVREIAGAAGAGDVGAGGAGFGGEVVDIADGVGGLGLGLEAAGVVGGELESVEEGAGALDVDAVGGEGVDNLGDGELDGFAVL